MSDLFYGHYSESFHLGEYPDFMDMLQEEERSALTEKFDLEYDSEFDFVWTALNNRLTAITKATAAGAHSPDSLKSLVELLSMRQEATKALAEGDKVEALDSRPGDGGYTEQMLASIRGFFQL